jgi:hypothetical protein
MSLFESGERVEDEEAGMVIRFEQRYGLEEIEFQLVGEPLEFFGVILYLIDTLRFKIKTEVVFDRFVELLLEAEKYDELVYFIDCFRKNIGGEDDNQEHAELVN